MIDLKAARQDPDTFRTALSRRGASADFDALLEVDARWREATDRVGSLRAAAKQRPKGRPTPEQVEQFKQEKEELRAAEDALAVADTERSEILARIPNLPDPTAADGMAEEDAVTVRTWGTPPAFDFPPRDHLDLASSTGRVDMARGARLSGSRFAYRFGDVARLEMALFRYVMDKLAGEGFVPVLGPVLANERAMYGTGFLPTEASNLYELEKDGLYLTGTSEVALAGIHMDEIVDLDALPASYVAFSTNFRREAGAAGKDTKGMFRVHQFDKVEMFVYCLPENSRDVHEELLAHEESIVQELGLPYRVQNIAVGDLGNPAAKKYDIEAWFPVQERYREITSCSNTTDYQARRLNVRFRREAGAPTENVHTLNGTGATARAMLAIMENFQDANGTVTVPEVLRAHGAPATVGTPPA
ncbi:Seryl-tRNA synthetase [Pseudonocardia sp. Ae406_Ps2]|uniref:serine--tRNA ligase n=1 Tax=unclassified Pseudonocardia TaxID=2619320 RepID=UPI00094B6750|nr:MULTISPECIES: serine--tRNA ligase [unclassified Pseudonocardia]OLL99557.1 Seryl-tRNA synthetase [Pseudonocardia sp. Ae331_Ps2]OLM02702.1 Seryl-tRNA synthetase [Pseudonocardia sp. Ae406_Ps2]OLM12462.1 Seryl-tRNA synthetase [Pseudonocardia sp. Ae505_Ps2]OLM24279.1 Seryl-tRNA synthetase [Pseudonocardia sp. Ae706_Ps2]OLM29787.1 Seryl-tRNA synthetase [Pseudonocardia sp. Ae717_Ps2]